MARPRHLWQGKAGSPSEAPKRPWAAPNPGQRQARALLSWTRRAKLVYALSLLGCVSALIVCVILWLMPPRPVRLVLIGARYEDNLALPHNVAGWNGLRSLATWADEHNAAALKSNQVEVRDESNLGNEKTIRDQILGGSLFSRRPPTLVVCVSAFGLLRKVKDDVVPCLARPDHLRGEGEPYPLDHLLDTLAELPGDLKKLLILDVTQVIAHWPAGAFHQGFVHVLQRRLDDRKIKNLVVISSAGENQQSWSSPRRGTTIFAHFLREGLKGAAGVDGGRSSGRINALDLYRYVRDNVERWAWQNRTRVQRPILFGDKELAGTMKLVAHDVYTATPLPQPAPPPYDELERAWTKCMRLRETVPSPAVYAPHLWREYLDRLLHAEQLLRAGQDAGAWKTTLDNLEQKIAESRALPRSSLALTLPMPQALGLQLFTATKLTQEFELLWQQRGDEENLSDAQRKLYEPLRKRIEQGLAKDRLSGQQMRLHLLGLILEKMAADPAANFVYGRQLLAHLDDRLAQLSPAEAHQVTMLRPDANTEDRSVIAPLLKAKRWPLLQKALQVRLLAERAAVGLGAKDSTLPAYSEKIRPWIRDLVEQADKQRRDGENLLFASSEDYWKKAEESLDEADKTYRLAQAIADQVRLALALRDQLMAELPFYTRWQAAPPVGVADFEQSLRELWRCTHALNQLFRQASEKPAPQPSVDKLKELTTGILPNWRKVREAAIESAAKDYTVAQTPDSWHEIEAVLQVPFLPVDTRRKLLRSSWEIAGVLEKRSSKSAPVSGYKDDKLDSAARKAAQRQGRLALAVLGDDWEDHADTAQAITQPNETDWHRSLQRAGEQYGNALVRLAQQAQDLTTSAEANLSEAGTKLARAASKARQVDGYLVGSPYLMDDPVGELKRLNLHDLLCWMAKRTRLDFWAAEPEDARNPYFRTAAMAFLRDARELVDPAQKGPAGRKNPRLERVNEEEKALDATLLPKLESSRSGAADDFRAGPVTLYPTDEAEVEQIYRLTGAGLPPGQPVCWVEHGKGLVIPRDFVPGQRPISVPASFRLRIIPKRQGPAKRQHRVVVYFRGHRSVVETTLQVQQEPDLMITQRAPLDAGRLAAHTRPGLYDRFAAKNTAISLVLDCSGSMNEKDKPGPKGRTRWDRATKALREVLTSLPPGVTVSLRAFGMHEKAKDSLPQYGFPQYGGIALVWEAHEWDPNKIDARMRKVEQLKPAYATPLVRTICMALKDFPKDFKGLRSVIAITDGADSNFYFKKNPRLDRDLKNSDDETIPEVLRRKFRAASRKGDDDLKDIQLYVIGFDLSKGEEGERAHKEIRKACAEREKEGKGKYFDAGNPRQLADILRRLLLHTHFWVDADVGNSIPDLATDGHSISLLDPRIALRNNFQWVTLKPLDYRVSIPTLRLLKQRIEIAPGDSLLLELVNDPRRGLAFRRSMYAELYANSKLGFAKLAPKDRSGWLLAALQNQQARAEEQLKILMTLEKEQPVARPKEQIHLTRPRWTWFEVSNPTSKGPRPRMRVFSSPDYPAPAWNLDLPFWPRETASSVRAWWMELGPLPRAGSMDKPLSQGEGKDRPWSTNKAEHEGTLIESIQIDPKCRVEIQPGIYREVRALVVRLRYPREREPYFVQAPEWTGHQQQRFYTTVGKSTTIFWPVTPQNVAGFGELHLISVADCKKKSLTVDPLDLGLPVETAGPRP